MIKYTYSNDWDAALSNLSVINTKNAQFVIEKIINNYGADDCIYGLFSAVSKADRRVAPFIATHNYCMRVDCITGDGQVDINVSPIYHLGPEYPNEYKEKHGTDLDKEAIIGLIELPAGDLTHQAHKTFSLGIDAGIVFEKSKIPHNKKMSLMLKQLDSGLMATLSCDTQTTSKMFTWEELNIKLSSRKQNQSRINA